MINLIPKEEKKRIVRVFHYKLIVLLLMVVGGSIFFAFISILPSYFVSLEINNIIDVKLQEQKNEPIPSIDKETLSVIKDLDGRLSLVENAESNKFNISEKIINAIILKKIPNVKITSVYYENNSDNKQLQNKSVNIQGNATSREILLLFRQSLENTIAFKQVSLPISNFIKSSNIQFSLSLIPS
ncbi:MAG: hypothetical protein WCG28_02640 [bacterium]